VHPTVAHAELQIREELGVTDLAWRECPGAGDWGFWPEEPPAPEARATPEAEPAPAGVAA